MLPTNINRKPGHAYLHSYKSSLLPFFDSTSQTIHRTRLTINLPYIVFEVIACFYSRFSQSLNQHFWQQLSLALVNKNKLLSLLRLCSPIVII